MKNKESIGHFHFSGCLSSSLKSTWSNNPAWELRLNFVLHGLRVLSKCKAQQYRNFFCIRCSLFKKSKWTAAWISDHQPTWPSFFRSFAHKCNWQLMTSWTRLILNKSLTASWLQAQSNQAGRGISKEWRSRTAPETVPNPNTIYYNEEQGRGWVDSFEKKKKQTKKQNTYWIVFILWVTQGEGRAGCCISGIKMQLVTRWDLGCQLGYWLGYGTFPPAGENRGGSTFPGKHWALAGVLMCSLRALGLSWVCGWVMPQWVDFPAPCDFPTAPCEFPTSWGWEATCVTTSGIFALTDLCLLSYQHTASIVLGLACI